MSARWRDKKGEPGFEYHAWMRTVDELEDQIADLVAALKEARADIWSGCSAQRAIAKIDAAIAEVESQS